MDKLAYSYDDLPIFKTQPKAHCLATS
jgi:hypothetical protein